jgi:hypothetical protein
MVASRSVHAQCGGVNKKARQGSLRAPLLYAVDTTLCLLVVPVDEAPIMPSVQEPGMRGCGWLSGGCRVAGAYFVGAGRSVFSPGDLRSTPY